MCQDIRKSDRKSATGWKVVAIPTKSEVSKHGLRYLSPMTRLPYIPGRKVHALPENGRGEETGEFSKIKHFISPYLFKYPLFEKTKNKEFFYNERMRKLRLTCVFDSIYPKYRIERRCLSSYGDSPLNKLFTIVKINIRMSDKRRYIYVGSYHFLTARLGNFIEYIDTPSWEEINSLHEYIESGVMYPGSLSQ